MKVFLKNLLFYLLNIFTPKLKNRASILMYHSVSDNNLFFTVKLGDFERQMNYLCKENFNVIGLAQLFDYLKNKREIPAKTVVLTFDDGYEDNYSNAFPVLKKYNFPATIFLTKGDTQLKMLNREQIKEMHDSGLIDFEPHTINHPKLSKTDLKEAEKEILESKKIIEKELNKKCRFFAYPYGDYNEKIIDIVKNNFELALTVEKGKVDLSGKLFEIKRNSIDSAVAFNQFKYIVKFGKI